MPPLSLPRVKRSEHFQELQDLPTVQVQVAGEQFVS